MAGRGRFLDKARDMARDLGGKAMKAVGDNSEKLDDAVDKAAEFVDSKTKRKYSRHVDKAQHAAHGAIDKLGDRPGGSGGSG